MTAKQGIYHPNCILFTHKFQTPVYHSFAKWLSNSYQYNIC